MKAKACATAILMLSIAALAQSATPAGTVLPVELNSALDSQKSQAGSSINARVMQDVPLPAGGKLRAGSRLIGKIVAVTPANDSQRAQITFRFDLLTLGDRSIPVVTSLRAIASPLEVEDAQIPKNGADRGTPSAWATRVLIGGEVAYGDGPVTRGNQIVGYALPAGILAPPRASHDCGGEGDDVTGQQAFWVFSSFACGVYGLSDVRLVHAGRTKPLGDVTLTSVNGKLVIRKGSGLLLRVNSNSH